MPTNVSAAEPSLFQFSTDALPERDRLAIWREQFGRQVARYEFEPLDRPVRGKVTVRRRLASASFRWTIPPCASLEPGSFSPTATTPWSCKFR